MYFFLSLIPATLAVVLGYFILFSSTKTQGVVKTFGRILAVWVLAAAALLWQAATQRMRACLL